MKAIKSIFYLAAAWGLMSLGSACNKNEAPTPEISLSTETAALASSGIQVNASENVKHLVFTSTTEWTVSALEKNGAIASWVAVYPASGKGGAAQVDAELVISANPLLTAREATVSIVSGDVTKTIAVKQAARGAVPATGMELSEEELVMHVEENFQLQLLFDPENADITGTLEWTSSNPAVASVKDGLVSALTVGETLITVKYGTLQDDCLVTVSASADAVRLNKIAITIQEQDTYQLVATVYPEGVLDVPEWTSSNPAVATVEDGLVTGIHEGEAEITVAVGSKSAKCKVTVEHRVIEVESVTLAEHEMTVEQGPSFTIGVSINPTDVDDPTLVWSSSKPEIVSVDPKTGVILPLAPGTAVITVASVNGKTDTCTITVTAKEGSHGEDMDDDIDVNPWN